MELKEVVKKALEKYPKAVLEYKKGKTKFIGLFAGEVMVQTRNSYKPKEVVRLVKEALLV